MGNLSKKYIGFCLLILLVFHVVYHIYSQPVQPNSRLFIDISANILEHGMYSFDGEVPTRMIQPLYTIFVMIFYHLLGLKASGVVLAQIIMDLIAFIFVLKTANLIFEKRMPGILPLLLAGHIAIWFFGLYILNECLYTFITTAAVYYLVKAVKHGQTGDFIITGALAGLALLTRPVGLGFIGFLFIPLVLFGRKIPQTWKKGILMYAAVILVILPWTIRNGLVMGRVTPLSSEDRYHLLYASLPDSVTQERDYLIFDPVTTEPDTLADRRSIMSEAVNNILEDPFGFISRGIGKVVMVWTNFPGTREFTNPYVVIFSKIVQYGLLAFVAIGFIRTDKRYALILILPAVFYSMILFFTYATTRFTVPALPFLIILAAQGFEPVLEFILRKTGLSKRKAAIPAANHE